MVQNVHMSSFPKRRASYLDVCDMLFTHMDLDIKREQMTTHPKGSRDGSHRFWVSVLVNLNVNLKMLGRAEARSANRNQKRALCSSEGDSGRDVTTSFSHNGSDC